MNSSIMGRRSSLIWHPSGVMKRGKRSRCEREIKRVALCKFVGRGKSLAWILSLFNISYLFRYTDIPFNVSVVDHCSSTDPTCLLLA